MVNNVILIGFISSGKTTLGRLLAEALDWDFIDTDLLIQEKFQKQLTCSQIFRKYGETQFRELERSAIASLHESQQKIIAVGGGAAQNAHSENVRILKSLGRVVYLDVEFEQLMVRIAQRPECPAVTEVGHEDSMRRLFLARQQDYVDAADETLSIGKETEREVLERLIHNSTP
jgi:shikimate kinase